MSKGTNAIPTERMGEAAECQLTVMTLLKLFEGHCRSY